MAYQEFYMDPAGSNLNAGSTSAAAASVTDLNGGWSTATNIFTASAGTPFSGVVAGEWASIYIDGAAIGVFTGRVTVVGGGGATITISTTERIGTPPVTSATTRTCKIGGAWASFQVMTSSFFGTSTTAGISTRINVKAATYANAAARSSNHSGTTVFPVCWRGYNTVIGDIDTNTALAKPLVTFSVGSLSLGVHNIWQQIDITCAVNGIALTMSTTSKIIRSVIINTNAGANGRALSGTSILAFECYFKATTTATSCIVQSSGITILVGCIVEGGVIGVSI